jgi:hypothetical protein
MLAELDIAGWTAQGNRSSIGAELVQADQMGGSIKRANWSLYCVYSQNT